MPFPSFACSRGFSIAPLAMYSGREKPLPAPNANVFTGRFVRGLCAITVTSFCELTRTLDFDVYKV